MDSDGGDNAPDPDDPFAAMEAMLAGGDDDDAAAASSDDDAGDGEMDDFAMLEAMLDG